MLFILIIILLFIIIFSFWGSLYKNDYDLTMIFGKKGSGKTTLLTKYCLEYLSKGWHVYSNTELYGANILDVQKIGHYDFPQNSLLIIDEVGMIWDNRNFKSFSSDVRDFFKLQRHKKVKCILASQSFDVDKKLRDLCDTMYLCSKKFGVFSIAKKIIKFPTIHNGNDSQNDNESFLTDDYKFSFFFFWRLTFIPRYIMFFNSFECEPLPRIRTSLYAFTHSYELAHYRDTYFYIRSIIGFILRYIKDYVYWFFHSLSYDYEIMSRLYYDL